MQVAIILLATAMFGELIWCLAMHHALQELSDILCNVTEHFTEKEDWANGTFERHAKLIEDNAKGLKALNEDICKLTDKMNDIDDLTAESLKAQIDADKAWADGVRALSGYGASIPRINTGGLKNE